jgi:thioredoxin-like negative regulator of GroEL
MFGLVGETEISEGVRGNWMSDGKPVSAFHALPPSEVLKSFITTVFGKPEPGGAAETYSVIR